MREVESFTRRRLPHWDMPDAAYFMTTCLEGSIPAEGLLDIKRYRLELEQRPQPENVDEHEWRRMLAKPGFARMDSWLDHKSAVRHLADPRLARIVVDAMYWFAGHRYDLLAFVVIPSHIHWVFQPLAAWVATLPDPDSVGHVLNVPDDARRVSNVPHRDGRHRRRQPRERIQHSVNRFTARRCNEALGTRGEFWQKESYDHWVRDVDELERIMRYVEANPVNSGLVAAPEEWPFSSAYYRKQLNKQFGEPLLH
ncbi:MAG: hypothetical protein L0215_24055 [Gemmataceae bacterium]|nr:hypothetical protein [Gemmataceae bacterium]